MSEMSALSWGLVCHAKRKVLIPGLDMVLPIINDTMVGKRISQEFLNLQHRRTLAMITDEAMTHLKSVSIVLIKQRKPLGESMMEMERLWNPNPLGVPLSAPIIIAMPQPCPET